MIPTHSEILSFYDSLPNDDKTPQGFRPRTSGRGVYAEWFLDQVSEGQYITRAGAVKTGHTAVRIRGLYLLEKALNKRARAERRAAKRAAKVAL